ncbi:MAG TPA: hypothetical protein VIK14_08025, partial [Ignavibacteria bacterium]
KALWLAKILPSVIIVLYVIGIILFPGIGLLYFVFTFIPVMIIYSLKAYRKYMNEVGTSLKNEKAELQKLVSTKITNINQLIKTINYRFYNEFDHYVNSYALEWLSGMMIYTEKFQTLIIDFCNNIKSKYEYYNKYWNENLIFNDDLFNKSIIDKNDCRRIFNEYESTILGFWNNPNNNISSFIITFSDNNSENKLSELENSLDNFIVKVFKDIEEKTIFDMILRDKFIKEKLPLDRRMALLISASVPFIKINEEYGNNKSSLLLNLFLQNKNSADSGIIEEFIEKENNKANNLSINNSDNDAEITLISQRVGFAAFQISQMDECKKAYEEIRSDNKININSFYSFKDALVYDIYPSKVEKMVYNSPEIFENIFSGRALGIIKYSDDGFTFNDKQLGKTIDELLLYFDRLKNEKEYKTLNSIIKEKVKNINDETVLKGLNSYLENNPDKLEDDILDKIKGKLFRHTREI